MFFKSVNTFPLFTERIFYACLQYHFNIGPGNIKKPYKRIFSFVTSIGRVKLKSALKILNTAKFLMKYNWVTNKINNYFTAFGILFRNTLKVLLALKTRHILAILPSHKT